ncbi:hypothetical protein [Streptomyces sp. URMC 123]|uniref:hypothetical protein n=1 Tax=Streptomyces sp. URMC 123 TaxID=3423403 RepID=UPI003F1BB951
MTVASRRSRNSQTRSKALRLAATLGAVSIGVVALSACEKPTPLATVTVGDTTVTTEETKSCSGDGKKLDQAALQKCLSDEPKNVKTISVKSGEKIRIGVEPEIAESGWVIVGGGDGMLNPSKDTYRSFDVDKFMTRRDEMGQPQARETALLSIVETQSEGGVKAMWHVKLKLKDS